jgi:hypothetical protein
MFSFWTLFRIVYSLLFGLLHIYISQFVIAIESRKNCPLKSSWKITNGKLLSSLFMIIAVINIFIPVSKFLSNLPVIGSSYVFIFCLLLLSELFIVNRLSININDEENKKCRPKNYTGLINFFDSKSIVECILFTVILSMPFFYL